MRRAALALAAASTVALVAAFSSGLASAQVAPTFPTGGVTATRIGTPEAGAAATGSATPRQIATTRTTWRTLPRWSDFASVRAILVNPTVLAIQRKNAGR